MIEIYHRYMNQKEGRVAILILDKKISKQGISSGMKRDVISW